MIPYDEISLGSWECVEKDTFFPVIPSLIVSW